jgi:hypothetical protein
MWVNLMEFGVKVGKKNRYFTPWALRAHRHILGFCSIKKGNIPLGRCALPLVAQARSFHSRAELSRHNRELCYNQLMAFIRKFETSSGATGVQVLYKEQGKVVKTVHVGSANSELGLRKLLKKAQKIKDEGKRPLFDLSDFDKK